MTSVRARTFCFCIPVRFGVFILSTLCLLGSAVITAIGWYSAAHKGMFCVIPRDLVLTIL
jgi:hypothetical protein